LLDVQPFGRAGEVKFLGHGQEASKVAKFHGILSSWSMAPPAFNGFGDGK